MHIFVRLGYCFLARAAGQRWMIGGGVWLLRLPLSAGTAVHQCMMHGNPWRYEVDPAKSFKIQTSMIGDLGDWLEQPDSTEKFAAAAARDFSPIEDPHLSAVRMLQ